MEQKKIYIEALNTYYKLKSKYDENFHKEIHKIINAKGLSWKEKRIAFSKLKRKCVNCNRPVGTRFSSSMKGKAIEDKHLLAMCGDRTNPCPLNIDINTSYITLITDFIKQDELELTTHKQAIIIDKNDLLFGYITSDEAVTKFDKIKSRITTLMANHEFEIQQYENIVDNPEKKALLKKLELEIYNNINALKTMMVDFNKSQNTQFISDIVELYINEMKPKLSKIMNLKYAYNAVEYNSVEDTYTLIQKLYSIEEFEQVLGEKDQEVISMIQGTNKKIKTNKKPVLIMESASENASDLEEAEEVEEEVEDEEYRDE